MNFRILIVEDEILVAMQIEEILEEHGFEVVGTCQSVSQALDRLSKPDPCDAVVLDGNLRSESAEPVANLLLAMKIPTIVVSGYSSKQLSGTLAATPIVAKPFRNEDLIAKLRHVLAASAVGESTNGHSLRVSSFTSGK